MEATYEAYLRLSHAACSLNTTQVTAVTANDDEPIDDDGHEVAGGDEATDDDGATDDEATDPITVRQPQWDGDDCRGIGYVGAGEPERDDAHRWFVKRIHWTGKLSNFLLIDVSLLSCRQRI